MQRFSNIEKSLNSDKQILLAQLEQERKRNQNGAHDADETAVEASRIDLERLFRQKLTEKEELLERLEEDKQDIISKYEDAIEQTEQAHENHVNSLEEQHTQIKEQHQSALAKAADDALMMKIAFDEHLRQMESEYEKEVSQLQDAHREETSQLKESVALARSEHDILQKKMLEGKRERQSADSEIKMVELHSQDLQRALGHEQRSNSLLREELSQRDAKLVEKEKQIADMKSEIRGLEKLKFLQDHQMTAMKEEVEPLNAELARMREHQTTLDKFKENDLIERQKNGASDEVTAAQSIWG